MQKITPFLWFDSEAEDAVNFYTSLFKNSKAGKTTRYDEAGAAATGRKAGSVMTIDFQLDGLDFTAINAGPVFKFNPSISFFVVSKDELEIDRLWKKFSDHGKILMELDKYDWSKKYGWVEDKFGLSWQLILAEDEVKQKIVPSLLFVDKVFGRAEEAIKFYTSIFKNSKIESVYKYPDNEKAVMYSDISLEGNLLAVMDGPGEHGFHFNEAISFVVSCENQNEVDYYWNKLTADGGAESMCGWLKDKFGVSWQIIPTILLTYISDKDPQKSQAVMQAMLKMKKIDVSLVEKAYNG
ncbi:MAG: VOC family protein [Ignavibacteriaceae bacterium]|nr:VOC family protein [Ignavibacteriaceae bacterium]